MIYFDHSATSFPKPKGMVEAMADCMLHYCGNPGRSGHRMSMKMGEEIYETRRSLAELLNIEHPERLIFTKNTTESLNLALKGFLKEGDHVVTTAMEHNSVLRPLKELEKDNVRHTIVKAGTSGGISVEDIARAITPATRLIVMTGASNVTGTIMPVEEVGILAESKGIPLLIDGAQCAGSVPVDVKKMRISMFAFPGHKGLLGPQGTAGLYVKPGISIRPILSGGTGIASKMQTQPLDYPEGFEAGTVNGPGIVGLRYAVGAVKSIGVETIQYYERELIWILEERLRNMETVKCYGPEGAGKTGVCLFNMKGLSSEEVTDRLSREYGIAVRGGYHCAPLAHKALGTWNSGAVRLSTGPFNTRKEIKAAADAIWHMSVHC